MDTDVRCVALVNGAAIPALSSSPDLALRHWRERALTAERYAQELDQALRDTIAEIDGYRRELAGIQADVAEIEAYCAEQADEIAELRTSRRAGLFLLTIGLLLVGYLAGVLAR